MDGNEVSGLEGDRNSSTFFLTEVAREAMPPLTPPSLLSPAPPVVGGVLLVWKKITSISRDKLQYIQEKKTFTLLQYTSNRLLTNYLSAQMWPCIQVAQNMHNRSSKQIIYRYSTNSPCISVEIV